MAAPNEHETGQNLLRAIPEVSACTGERRHSVICTCALGFAIAKVNPMCSPKTDTSNCDNMCGRLHNNCIYSHELATFGTCETSWAVRLLVASAAGG